MTDSELLEPAEARAANPHLRGLGSSSCPYGECDGNGLVLQESGDAFPCRCRAERIARNRTRGLHDTIPERSLEKTPLGLDHWSRERTHRSVIEVGDPIGNRKQLPKRLHLQPPLTARFCQGVAQ